MDSRSAQQTPGLPPGSRLPLDVGVGFKPQHFADIAADIARGGPAVGFFEVHAENYMGAGGPPQARLSALHERHAISVHGVGLSIGGAEPLDAEHLGRLVRLCERHRPESVSEHLAWSGHAGTWLDDLLPLPYTGETLRRVAAHVARVQDALRRPILLENPATYLLFAESTWAEADFLREIVARTGCGLLLDLNNVYVSAVNHGTDPRDYLAGIPMAAVGEIHLAGHAEATDAGETEPGSTKAGGAGAQAGRLLIDSHDAPVAEPVWALYAAVLAAAGPRPTLIEWDGNLPDWPVLLAEARRARHLLAARSSAAVAGRDAA
jgi:uncharacterized protein (UPF0276 family)